MAGASKPFLAIFLQFTRFTMILYNGTGSDGVYSANATLVGLCFLKCWTPPDKLCAALAGAYY
jgi:hypothetical protein